VGEAGSKNFNFISFLSTSISELPQHAAHFQAHNAALLFLAEVVQKQPLFQHAGLSELNAVL